MERGVKILLYGPYELIDTPIPHSPLMPYVICVRPLVGIVAVYWSKLSIFCFVPPNARKTHLKLFSFTFLIDIDWMMRRWKQRKTESMNRYWQQICSSLVHVIIFRFYTKIELVHVFASWHNMQPANINAIYFINNIIA